MLRDRRYYSENPLYRAAQDQELAPDQYSGIDMASGAPGFVNPAYSAGVFLDFQDAAYGKLSTFSEDFKHRMRSACARKIGRYVPEDNFLIGFSTFNFYRYLLQVMPEYNRKTNKVVQFPGNKFASDPVVISPEGGYLLWNRLGGEMAQTPDGISPMKTARARSYKITGEDIDRWAAKNADHYRGRPLVMPLENPSIAGHVYTADELKDIHAASLRHGVFIFYDEVYRETCAPDVEFCSLPSVVDDMNNVLAVTTFSKGYGNSQFNLAGAVAPKQLADLLYPHFKDEWRKSTSNHIKMVDHLISHSDAPYLEEARTLYAEKTNFIVQKIQAMNQTLYRPLEIVHYPQAGYSMFIDLTNAITGQNTISPQDGDTMHKSLFSTLAQRGLVTQPLHASGIRDRLVFRIVYGNDTIEEINQGLDIMGSVVRDYQRHNRLDYTAEM